MAGPHLLYVEDHPADILLLKEAFHQVREDVTIQAIGNAGEAYRYLLVKATARDMPPPDLILFDVFLGSTTAAELIHFVSTSPAFSDVPWFGLTSQEGCDLMHLDRDRCMIKPMDWDGYLHLVDRLIAALSEARSGQRA